MKQPFDGSDCSKDGSGLPSRRDFLKLALAASSLSLLPDLGFSSVADERTAWYRAAKFGMFIHWGPYSLASIEASWLSLIHI